jgi:pimeloyl-ACP methyl ester carboxylesterase
VAATVRKRRGFRPFDRFFAGEAPHAERLRVKAADGVELNVLRVRSGKASGPAVMLLHGLASHSISFHFPERSLATYLASRVFDCFVPDLRGAGESDEIAPSQWFELHLIFHQPESHWRIQDWQRPVRG